MALFFAAGTTCFVMALARTSVANVLIIHSTAPFIAGLIGWLWLGERVSPRTWVAMTAALGGTVLMVSASVGRRSLTGDGLAAVTALSFAAATVIMRRRRAVRMLPAACLAVTFGAAFAFPQAAPGTAGARDLVLLALFGMGQLGVGLSLYTAGARLIPAAEAALIAVLESILGPIWVWLAVGESPGALSLAGGAVVLGALAVHTALDLRRPDPPTTRAVRGSG
ncbi:MAG: EamA family transporter [Candidatus Rokubacteria bacterium]|nr:EamA family transporter [Candidatus Rokubacteria bacterium]MBI2526352.1 EamA family transporter [Candidatus Rokubacteria bacterium]